MTHPRTLPALARAHTETVAALIEAAEHAQRPCDALAPAETAPPLTATADALTATLDRLAACVRALLPTFPPERACSYCIDIECHLHEALAAIDYAKELP